MENLTEQLIPFGISMGILVLFTGAVFLAHLGLLRLFSRKPDKQYLRQGILLGTTLILLALALVVLPVSDELQGQLFAVLGLFLGAGVALSSAKPVGNIIAGISVRASQPCSRGDSVQVGEHIGRVIRMDLLGIELQTADNDSVYLPNLYLLDNPVRVNYGRSLLVCQDVSLAYSVPRIQIETLLRQAAAAAELEQAIVEVSALTDEAVCYRIAGRASDEHKVTEQQLALRSFVLDTLQAAGLAPATAVTSAPVTVAVSQPQQPVAPQAEPAEPVPEISPAELEKQVGELKELKKEYTDMSQKLIEIEQNLRDAGPGEERKPLNLEKKKLEARLLRIEKEIAQTEAIVDAA